MSFLPWHVLPSPEWESLLPWPAHVMLTHLCHINSCIKVTFYMFYLYIDKIAVNGENTYICLYSSSLAKGTSFYVTQCLGYRRHEEMFCGWAQLQVVESRKIIQEDFIYLFQHIVCNAARMSGYDCIECMLVQALQI